MIGRRLTSQYFDWLTDAEGDDVIFSSDEELTVALGSIQGDIFRVTIKERAPEKQRHGQDKVHPRVICDGCEGKVKGIRYKCVTCDDYDLCATCEDKGIHSEHNMIRITSPLHNARAWMVSRTYHLDNCTIRLRLLTSRAMICRSARLHNEKLT